MEEIQKVVEKHCKEKGYDKQSLELKFLILTEEVGELAKAVRKHTASKIGNHSKKKEVEEEVADVIYLISAICNDLGVNITESFRKKFEVIKRRK